MAVLLLFYCCGVFFCFVSVLMRVKAHLVDCFSALEQLLDRLQFSMSCCKFQKWKRALAAVFFPVLLSVLIFPHSVNPTLSTYKYTGEFLRSVTLPLGPLGKNQAQEHQEDGQEITAVTMSGHEVKSHVNLCLGLRFDPRTSEAWYIFSFDVSPFTNALSSSTLAMWNRGLLISITAAQLT